MSSWTNSGDKELWILPVGELRAPHICTPGTVEGVKGTVWLVTLANYIGGMLTHLTKIKDPLLLMKVPEGDLIGDDTFRKHFEKASGITPEYYLKTMTFDGKRNISFKIDKELFDEKTRATVDTKFIDWVTEKTSIATPEELRLIWLTISQMMPQYLLEKHAPVDFGWGRLFALPYRANWKQILYAKFPRIWKWLKNPREHHKLEIAPFATESRKADLLALKAHGGGWVICWTPEFQPNKLWHDYSYEVEKKVFATSSPRAYLVRIGHLFSRFWPHLVTLLRSHVELTNMACGDIANQGHSTAQKLVAFVPTGFVHPVPMENPPVSVCSDDCDDGLYPSSVKPNTKGEGAYVQEVPFVRLDLEDGPDVRDVRKGG